MNPNRFAGKQCAQKKKNGKRCRANALADSKFCFFHDPSRKAERAAARRAGGKSRSRPAAMLPTGTPISSVESVEDVRRLLSETMRHVLLGRVDAKISNAVSQLCSVYLRAADAGEFATRLAAVEKTLSEMAEQAERGRPIR